MGEVDKPFGCPQPGCGMSFINEDRLTVHRRHHEMQLTVNGEHHTSSLVKHTGFIIDQTPTPTRFLRQCEEVGLFQEISLNPFDEQFRRASLLRSHHSITESLGGNGESLDTPRVLPPPADSDETISSTSRDDICGTTSTTTVTSTLSTTSHASYVPSHTTCTTCTTCPGSLHSARVLDVVEDEPDRGEAAARRLSLNVSSAAEAAGQQTGSVISTPTPVITAGPSVTQSLGTIEIGSAASMRVGGAAPALAQQPAFCAAPGSVPPSPSATVLQLLLRLPNGQSIPVEIPATPVVSSAAQGGTSTTTTLTASSLVSSPPHTHDRSPHQSLAKMKLKQALASSSTAARPGGSKTSRANTADRIAEMTRSRNFSGTSSTEGEYDDDGPCGSHYTNGKRERRNSSDNEDPVVKRKKFLERNRAAAIRCREKKKKWIENLSVKYDELGSINQKLQSEVSSLRSEVAVLKSMLLQHKDCPVTLAMQDGCFDGMNGCCGMVPLPPMPVPVPVPVPEATHTYKPRTRSLSLPSISSSESTPVEPLPVNLSYSVYASPPTTTVVTTAASLSDKVSVVPPGMSGRGGTASISPVNLTNSFMANQHPSPYSPATSIACLPQTGTIIKISPGAVPRGQAASPQQQLLAPAMVPSSLTPRGHAGKMGKIMLGPSEILTAEVNPKSAVVMNGMPNVIMAAAAPVSHAALSPPQLLNLTLATHPRHPPTVLRKSN